MSAGEAADLRQSDATSGDALFPYLNGKDFNDSPRQLASRWIINFFDWPLERARKYSKCVEIVERLVRPERLAQSYSAHAAKNWWQYERPRLELCNAISAFEFVLVIGNTSKSVLPAFVQARQVLDKQPTVLAYDDIAHFAVLSTAFHWHWALRHGSTQETRPRYTPTDVFETFPQPEPQSGPAWNRIATAGRALNDFRAPLMVRTNLGHQDVQPGPRSRRARPRNRPPS